MGKTAYQGELKLGRLEIDGNVVYDEEQGIGFYHTGTDSFDNPEIKHFGEHRDMHFQWGPFSSFQEAKKDLSEMLKNDIENLKYCLSNVRRLKETK